MITSGIQRNAATMKKLFFTNWFCDIYSSIHSGLSPHIRMLTASLLCPTRRLAWMLCDLSSRSRPGPLGGHGRSAGVLRDAFPQNPCHRRTPPFMIFSVMVCTWPIVAFSLIPLNHKTTFCEAQKHSLTRQSHSFMRQIVGARS